MLSSARRVPRLAAPVARAFSQSGAPKRPRAVRVKKSEARRSVPEPERPPRHALAEVPPPPQAPAPFLPQEQQQAPQTFGGVMKEVRLSYLVRGLHYCIMDIETLTF